MGRVLSGFVLLLVLVVPVMAEAPKAGEAKRSKEAQQAERNQANAIIFAKGLCVVFGRFLVLVAVGIARNGLGFGPRPRRMTGLAAWVAAVVMGAIGLAVAIGGVLYIPELLAPPDADQR